MRFVRLLLGGGAKKVAATNFALYPFLCPDATKLDRISMDGVDAATSPTGKPCGWLENFL